MAAGATALRQLKPQRKWKIATTVVFSTYLGLLMVSAQAEQDGYVTLWHERQQFWRQLFQLCPDLTDRTVIICDGTLPQPSKVMPASCWSDSAVLSQAYQFPTTFTQNPQVICFPADSSGNGWRTYITRNAMGRPVWNKFVTGIRDGAELIEGNTILLHMDDRGLIKRINEKVQIDGKPFTLRNSAGRAIIAVFQASIVSHSPRRKPVSDASGLLLLITDLELGGTPTVVRELAIRLMQTGMKVQVACLSKWGPVADQLREAGVPVTALNAKGARDLSILPRLIRFIREANFKTVFSFLMHANTMAAAASLRFSNVHWIQSIQTTQPWPRWHWKVQRIAQHAADKIVVPSQSVADAAIRWAHTPTEKIVIIPNAIDPADWVDSQSSVPGKNPRPYPVLFLGRLDPIKDVPTLVKAATLLGGLVQLHIFGEGADQIRIENTVKETGASIILHGAIAKPQAAMVQSGLLVLPSLAEGFGLVLVEAMAAGVPVLATNVAGIRDVIRNGENGLLVPAKNPDAMAKGIAQIVNNPSLRQQLITQGRHDVKYSFSWDAVLTQYQQLLSR